MLLFTQCKSTELKKILLSDSLIPTSYSVGDVEQLEHIKAMSVTMRDGYYEIKITYFHECVDKYKELHDEQAGTTTEPDNCKDYITFKGKNIKSKGKIIKGEISKNVTLEVNNWAYHYDNANGTIEIDTINNTVNIEITMGTKYIIGFKIITQ